MKVISLLALVVMLSFATTDEDAATGIDWRPSHNKECTQDFSTFADKSVDQCKLICAQIDGCDEFSSPIENHRKGCRIAKGKGGCAVSDGSATSYKMHHVIITSGMEDEEGPGSRRRRRTDSRRRTHMPIVTDSSQKIAELKDKKEAKDKQKALDDASMAGAAQDSKAILKEIKIKGKYKHLQTIIEATTDRKGAGITTPTKRGGEEKTLLQQAAEAQDATLSKQYSALQVQLPALQANSQKVEGAFDSAVVNAKRVTEKLLATEAAVEQMMTDPGAMADQDRAIAVAILGKLRVAGALVSGDFPALDPEQGKHEYLVHLKDSMMIALRNPSEKNMEDAKIAYKTATKILTNDAQGDVDATKQEADDLKKKAKAQENEQQLAAENQQSENEEKQVLVETAQAAAKEKLTEQAITASGDPTAVAPVVQMPKLKIPFADPDVVKVQRGFYDPPGDGGELDLGTARSEPATYKPSTNLPGDFMI